MNDIFRIFLVCVCMYLCFKLGMKAERETTTKKIMRSFGELVEKAAITLQKIADDAEKQNMDAPVPDVLDEKD